MRSKSRVIGRYDADCRAAWVETGIGTKFTFTSKPKRLRIGNRRGVPFLPMEQIPSGVLYISDYLERLGQEMTNGTYFEEGDLLVSKITPCFENGKQGIARDVPGGWGIASTEVIPLKSSEAHGCLPFLAFYLLDAEVRAALSATMEGATGRKRLSKEVLAQWVMPWPPVQEQRAIAGVLLRIQRAMEVQEKVVKRLKELKAAMMEKLFREGMRRAQVKPTAIGLIPHSWSAVELATIARVRTSSLNFGQIEKGVPNQANGLRVLALKVSDLNRVGNEVFLRSAAKEVLLPEDLAAKNTIPPGAIVFPKRGGAIATNKKRMTVTWTILDPNLIALVPMPGISGSYLFQWFLSFDIGTLQVPGAVPQLNKKDLDPVLVPIPASREEQQAVAGELGQIDQRIAIHNSHVDCLTTLFETMLHLLMTGKVRVRDLKLDERILEGDSPAGGEGKVDEGVLKEIVRRIVESVGPEKIILFGSAARGEMGPESDVDVMVVKAGVHRRHTAERLYQALYGVPIPVDVVVARPEDLDQYGSCSALVYEPALTEGKVIYAA